MLTDVKHKISDFGIGASTVKGEGIHIKIGVSPIVSDIPMTITSTMEPEDVREKLGHSPLSDSIIESLQAGCSMIYALPAQAGKDGTIGELQGELTGTGSMTVEGKPHHALTITVKITASGALNVGTFHVVVDEIGELEEETLPVGGSYEIPSTGIILKFAEGEYVQGDKVTFETTRPRLSNEGILKTIGKLKNLPIPFEFIHIAEETENELWAALTVEADKFFEVYYKPCIMVCETRSIQDDETLDAYMQYLRLQKQGVVSWNLQVVPARLSYMRSGEKVEINAASLIVGLHAQAKVQQSIGEVALFAIKGALELLPKGIEDYLSELDDLGYTTLRQYAGVEGIYVNNSKTFAPEGSDYLYTERVRTMYKAVRETRKTALLKMHSQIDISNIEKSIKAITEFINIPVERMVEQKEFSSAHVIIPEGQDLLGAEKLVFKIRAVPVGILREIEMDMGFENPSLRKE